MALKINDNGTTREMTTDEQATHEAWSVIAQIEAQTSADTLTAKQAARQAVLDKLGLSADEAEALLG